MTVLVITGLVVLAICIYMALAPVPVVRRQDRMSQRWLEKQWLADARREPYDQDQELGG